MWAHVLEKAVQRSLKAGHTQDLVGPKGSHAGPKMHMCRFGNGNIHWGIFKAPRNRQKR